MNPVSVRGVRRQIRRIQSKGGTVPQKLLQQLDEALLLEAHIRRTGLPKDEQEARKIHRSKRHQGLEGSTYGPASRGRTLTGPELEARKRELESK